MLVFKYKTNIYFIVHEVSNISAICVTDDNTLLLANVIS